MRIYLWAYLIAFFSLVDFLFDYWTAFNWPAVDMGPFFERLNNPTFLTNDFFTNASMTPNPRHVFGYIVFFLTKLFHTDWYSVFFFLKLVIVIFLPAVIFLVLADAVKDHTENLLHKKISMWLLVLFVSLSNIACLTGFFTIAWWDPMLRQVTPQDLSMLTAFTAMLVDRSERKNNWIYSNLLFAFSTLLHPAVGLMCFIFYGLMFFKKERLPSWIKTFFIGCLFPIVTIKTFFSSSDGLLANQFIETYCLNQHGFHYVPSQFGSSTPWPWIASLLIVAFALIVPAVYGRIRQNKRIFHLSVLFLLSYLISVGLQYIGVEIIPVKTIAVIGPSRFTMFGFWMVSLAWSLMAGDIISQGIEKRIKLNNPVLPTHFHRFVHSPFNFTAIFLILSVFLYPWIKDNPIEHIGSLDPGLYSWINRQSDPNSVFVLPHAELGKHFQLVARRSIFVPHGFPFSEKNFKEFDRRKSLVYGHLNYPRDVSVDERFNREKFYRTLTPDDFVRISRGNKIDYVFIEKGYHQSFAHIKPKFENDRWLIYAAEQLNNK